MNKYEDIGQKAMLLSGVPTRLPGTGAEIRWDIGDNAGLLELYLPEPPVLVCTVRLLSPEELAVLDSGTLRQARERTAVSLRRVAAASGLSYAYLSTVERGELGRPVTRGVVAAYRQAGVVLPGVAVGVPGADGRRTGQLVIPAEAGGGLALPEQPAVYRTPAAEGAARMRRVLMRTVLMRQGRWAARLLLDVCQPGEQDGRLPSWAALIWLTRSVDQEQVDHYWSESGRAGVVPAVETALLRITLRRWWGPPLVLWRTTVRVQVWAGGVVSLERHQAFADADAAGRDFATHRDGLRETLVGESRYPDEWREAAQLRGGAVAP